MFTIGGRCRIIEEEIKIKMKHQTKLSLKAKTIIILHVSAEEKFNLEDAMCTGNFLELKNESNHVKKLGFYRIKRIVGDSVIEVPLPEFTRIQPTSSLVIRCGSSETPILNSNTIILENVGHWLSGELMQTFLLDPRGVEVASIVQKELDYA
ncbi:unnamed protein product [Caenorhabditis angaria]|uniref:LTD domain-containing protein n=1 Tax=Caenorhabditis angaria TaxID=860376 RepID=A0A9P1MYF1_9PELO|nr:unnamed protein product [Caenorhabditis angaria]